MMMMEYYHCIENTEVDVMEVTLLVVKEVMTMITTTIMLEIMIVTTSTRASNINTTGGIGYHQHNRHHHCIKNRL